MTVVNPPGFLQNLSTHSAEILRGVPAAMLAGTLSSASLKPRGGVARGLGGGLAVTQNGTPNMTVNVASGYAMVSGTEDANQGTYVVHNDGTVNLSLTAADGTNPRIDLVVFRVQDQQYSGGTNSSSLAIIAGTPAGSPSPPAAPANSIVLAQLSVPAGDTTITTGQITDMRPFLAGEGGVIPVLNASRRPASTEVLTGQRIKELDTGYYYEWNGSKWLRERATVTLITAEARTTTTTYADVDAAKTLNSTGFLFPVEANSRYLFDIDFGIQANVSVGLKMNMVYPSGASVDIGWIGTTIAGAMTTNWTQSYTSGNDIGVMGGTGGSSYHRVKGVILTGGTAGTAKFQIAQGASGVSSFLLVGSRINHWQVS